MSAPDGPPPAPDGPPPGEPPPLALWLLLIAVVLVLIPVAILIGVLMPGAAMLQAWDCLSDLDCRIALSGRGQYHARPVHHQGAWAAVMGVLIGAVGVMVTGGIVRSALEWRWERPPWAVVVPVAAFVLAAEVALVRWLDMAL